MPDAKPHKQKTKPCYRGAVGT